MNWTTNRQRSGAMLAILLLFTVTVGAGWGKPLRAEEAADINCSGDYCSKLPYSDSELDSILYGLKNDYAQLLFDDMTEAAVLANIAGVPMGTINLEKFVFGVSASAGYKPVHYETVTIPGVTTVEELPSAGAAIIPKMYVGVNIGSLFGMNYDPYADPEDYKDNPDEMPVTSPSMLSPLRFDLYLSYLDFSDDYAVSDSSVNIDFESKYRGVELRYHLLEGGGIIAGPMLRFRGLSVGLGAYKSLQNFTITRSDSDMKFPAASGASVVWQGTDVIQIKHNIDSYVFDVRSGIQLFYILNLSAGIGAASNKGSSSYILSRTGPVSLVADPALIALLSDQTGAIPDSVDLTSGGSNTALTQAELQQLVDTGKIADAAVLTMLIKGNADVPRTITYGRLGVELNMWVAKLGVEAIATKNSYAANVGLRVEF